MSVLAKDCPDCGETNPAYAVRCRCGYEFNETVDYGDEENDDLAVTIQEEELYLEYLNARAQQASADARRAAQAAAEQPKNKAAASQAERAQMAAQTAHAEFESQQARVATAIKTLKGNNPASPLANSGSARQTSAPAISQALPSIAAPPRTPPKSTAPPTPRAMSGRPANASSPVTSSTSVNKPSDGQVTPATRVPSAQTAGAEPRKASGGTGAPLPIAPEKVKVPVPSKPAAVAATGGMPEKTSSARGDRNAAATTPEPSATPPLDSKPVTDERAAVAKASPASATDGNPARGKPMDTPKAGPQDNDKRDSAPKTPPSAVANATPKPAAPDQSADRQQDAASAKAMAAAARAKELTEKLKAAQAARAAKAQSASAAPSIGKPAPSTKTTPPKSSSAMQTSTQAPQTAPTASAASVVEPTTPVNGQHRNGHDNLVAELDAIQIPGADASHAESVSAPSANIDASRGKPDLKDLGGTAPASPAEPPDGVADSGGVAPTVTVSAEPSVDPQAELEAALRALTARPPAPAPNERSSASSGDTAAAAQTPPADTAETRPAAVTSSVPADKKDCPNCTALLPLKEMRCRCGYTFPTVDQTMPGLSLSDSDLAAMGDESPRDRITHLG